jgi:hypothetical protein
MKAVPDINVLIDFIEAGRVMAKVGAEGVDKFSPHSAWMLPV